MASRDRLYDLLAAFVCTCPFCFPLQAANLYYMNSEDGDYVGQGLEKTLTEPDYTFSASKNYDNGVHLYVKTPDYSSTWSLDFAAPGDALLTPGAYEVATRFPFQSITNPGLSVNGEGRGCNTLTGRFVIHEVVYGLNNAIDVFAADFEQHCEGGVPALFGAIRYNSMVPVFSPQPTASAGLDQHVTEGDVVVLDGSNSAPGSGSTMQSYHWAQTGGTPVDLMNSDSAVVSFIAPAVTIAGDTLSFQLSVYNSSGDTATDAVDIHVVSLDAPKTFVKMFSEEGDYIGQGQSYNVNANNGVIALSSSDFDKASLTYQGTENWYFHFSAPQGTGLSLGTYHNATRLLGVATSNPGMDVFGAGRGCNTLTGEFDVLEVLWDTTGTIESLAIDFVQHCEGLMPPLKGSVRYNSTVPPTNNEPKVAIVSPGNDSTHIEGSPVTFSATALDPEDGDITASIVWTAPGHVLPEGPIVTLSSLGAGTHTFTATVSDSAGAAAVQTVTVEVITNTPPTLQVISPENGSVVSQGDLVSLQANANDNEEGDVSQTVAWSSNLDGAIGTGGQVDVAWLSAGEHVITAVAVDGDGASVMTNVVVIVQPPTNTAPQISILAPMDNATIRYGQTLALQASSTDTEDGSRSAWIVWSSSLDGYLGTGASISADMLSLGAHVITATVSDSGGLSSSATISVSVTADNPGYCTSAGRSVRYEYIQAVRVGGVEKISGVNGGYADFTRDAAIPMVTGINPVTLTPGFPYSAYYEHWTVWIDFNGDQTFGLDEQVYAGVANRIINATVMIPPDAKGTMRMRVAMQYGQYPVACGTFPYGEVEDYTIVVH